MRPEDYRRHVRETVSTNVGNLKHPAAPAWRFGRTCEVYGRGAARCEMITLRQYGRDMANLLARARNDDAEDYEFVQAYNDKPTRILAPALRAIQEAAKDAGLEVEYCDNCGDAVCADRARWTPDTQPLCEVCMESDFRYSDVEGGFIPSDSVYPVYTRATGYARYGYNCDDWCTLEFGQTNLCQHTTTADVRIFFTSSSVREAYSWDYENEEEDDEEEDADSYLADYHSSSNRRDGYFDERNNTPARPALGLEVEVYAEHRDDALYRLRSHDNDLISGMVYERDGSLHYGKSFEVVTPPLGATEWATFGPELCSALTTAGCVGFNTPDRKQRYGIHVNIHRRWFSPLAEARVMMFLCAGQNVAFVRALAQRDNIYSATVDIGHFSEEGQNIRRLGGLCSYTGGATCPPSTPRPNKKINGRGKYAPVRLQTGPDIMEFRMFQSTLNPASFMKNIELVYALWDWTRPESATGSSWHHKDFLCWLAQPAQRKEYPALVKFLRKKSFRQWGGSTITNTWRAHLDMPAGSSARTKEEDCGEFVELTAA